jgi:intracellular sulfur oxidation DsrE/DsrF family protein
LKTLDGTPWAKDAIDPELGKRMDGLSKYGVEVYLCQITFKSYNIDINQAKDASYIKLVPSGVATVGVLQAKGYGYLKVG